MVQSLALEDPFGADDNTSKAVVPVATETSLQRSNVVFAPRPDRLRQIVTPGNAQGLFPPSAALFVARHVSLCLFPTQILTFAACAISDLMISLMSLSTEPSIRLASVMSAFDAISTNNHTRSSSMRYVMFIYCDLVSILNHSRTKTMLSSRWRT